jgi:hypothetical protein
MKSGLDWRANLLLPLCGWYFWAIDPYLGSSETSRPMSHYAPLIGKRVEAHYRASDLNLLAVGTLVADTGSSIFIEDRFTQNGREKKMRLEIPYPHVHRIFERAEAGDADSVAAIVVMRDKDPGRNPRS